MARTYCLPDGARAMGIAALDEQGNATMGAVFDLLRIPVSTHAEQARAIALAAAAMMTIGLLRTMWISVIGAVWLGDTGLMAEVPMLGDAATLSLAGTGVLYLLCRR